MPLKAWFHCLRHAVKRFFGLIKKKNPKNTCLIKMY